MEGGEYQCQIYVYAYHKYSTLLLDDNSLEKCGTIVGGQYNIPIMLETVGRLSGGGLVLTLCNYIFMISQKQIQKQKMLKTCGIDANWVLSPDTYSALAKRFSSFERKNGFMELMHYIENNSEITSLTNDMIDNTVTYGEHFHSKITPDKKEVVKFQENLTLLAAKEATLKRKRTAVLNFANPVEPGGGVLRGAAAQEESLCRSSNLYKSLISKNARMYYERNQAISAKNQFNSMFIGTDAVIYSPDVIVLKENTDYRPYIVCSVSERYCRHPFLLM